MNKGKGKQDAEPSLEESDLPWVEKYRPQSFEQVVAHQDILTTLERFVESEKIPHLLFYGPPGTGKTTTILALARRIYGKSFRNQVMELNASDDRGIDVVREQIKTFASTRQIFESKFKLIILDEADAMTLAAQNALRRIIEKYTRNVRFCLICNYINKIAPAIQSRCTKFRFQPLPIKEIATRLDYVVANEAVRITPEAKDAVLKLSKGDMRKALNILQACHAAYDEIDTDAVYNCVGNPHPDDIEAIVHSTMEDDFVTCAQRLSAMKRERGLALQDILGGVFEALDDLQLPAAMRIFVLDQLAAIEQRLSTGASEKIQMTAMIAAIKQGCELAAK